jgi:two-component system phosphate regulon sensor histidine kinase PhoR
MLNTRAHPATDAEADALADRLGRTTGARVTLIAENGHVLGDSQISPHEVMRMETHERRPEVKQALATGRGVARRYSTTIGADLLYVAVPFGRQGSVVRVAAGLSEVDAAVGRLRLASLLVMVLGIVVAAFMSGLASRLSSRALTSLVHSARAVVTGRLGRRLPISSSDEMATIAGSFNQLAEELEGTVRSLAEERERLEAILEDMSEGVLTVDANRRVTLANRSAIALLRPSAPPQSRDLLETVRSPQLVELIVAAERGDGAVAELEIVVPSRRTVVARATPLRRTGGVVVVMHDVTEMRRLEAVRRDFVANVSHELRTPVSIVRANAETLLDALEFSGQKEARDFLTAIHRNAERLSALIADLLDLSRIEAGRYELELGPCTVHEHAQRAVDAVEGVARERHLSIAVSVPGDVLALADGRALEHVLGNLLDNAVKYTEPGGHVVVAAELRDAAVRITVTDDGPGIEPRHRQRIFERFYRADPGRSREMGGTGLGLSIVKHLAAAMGGEVGVEPARPRGSTFWLVLRTASNGSSTRQDALEVTETA